MAYQIPLHFRHTRSTPFWTKETVPQALLTHHNTKKGVYGRLSVMQGAVKYFGFATYLVEQEGLSSMIQPTCQGGHLYVQYHPDEDEAVERLGVESAQNYE